MKSRLTEARVLLFPFFNFILHFFLLWDSCELRRLSSTDSNSKDFICAHSGFPSSVYVGVRTAYFRKDDVISFLNMKRILMSKCAFRTINCLSRNVAIDATPRLAP
jgi:hypothetical protein